MIIKKLINRTTRRLAYIVPLTVGLSFGACNSLEAPDFNNPGLDELTTNPNRASILTAAQGLIIGARAGISARAGYISSLGIMGRESYNFDPSDPRFVTGLLVGPLDGSSNAFGGAHWVFRYSNIRMGNIVQVAVDAAAGEFTSEEAEAIRGFAKTMQAHDLLLAINTRDTFGAPIDVDGDPTGDPAPIATKAEVLTRIVQLLDDGATDLAAGGSSFPFQMSSGFTNFNTPATFATFNRALKARVEVYRQNWTSALTALGQSFLNAAPSGVSELEVGVFHAFSTAPGDVTNGIFDPSRLVIVAHPSIVTDAQAGDDRLARKVVQIPVIEDQTGRGVETDRAYDIYDGLDAKIPLIKNEELILLRAEASLQNGDLAGALADINTVRTVSGNLPAIASAAWTALTLTQQIDELLYNRRYSLMFEGQRWIDMRRYDRLTDLPIDIDNTGAVTDFLRFSQFPFPARECDARAANLPSQGCSQIVGF